MWIPNSVYAVAKGLNYGLELFNADDPSSESVASVTTEFLATHTELDSFLFVTGRKLLALQNRGVTAGA
jgi:phage-related protein